MIFRARNHAALGTHQVVVCEVRGAAVRAEGPVRVGRAPGGGVGSGELRVGPQLERRGATREEPVRTKGRGVVCVFV